MTHATRGQHVPACEWLERGIAIAQKVGDRVPPGVFLVDPEVTLRAIIAVPLMSRGLADQARAHAARGIERAKQIGQPMARALSLRCAASLEIRLKLFESARDHVEQLREVVETNMLAPPAGPTLWLRGWSEAHFGDAAAGLRLVLEGHELHSRQGMIVLCTEGLMHAAEAALRCKDLAAARNYLDEALEHSKRLDEGLMLPDLLLLQARIALTEGDIGAARASMQDSVRAAQKWEALANELDARVALAELPDQSGEDIESLAVTYGRVTEGFDIPVCVRARELLGG